MEPNFLALQVIAEASLGILGFSAILIGLSRATDGFKALFTLRLFFFQTGILSTIFLLSISMIMDVIDLKSNVYVICLLLFLVQSSVAFIRTMFYRVT